MTAISNELLSDTLNLIQLARETARLQGKQARFEHLDPVVDNLRTLVSEAQTPTPPAGPALVMQDDFQTLLAAVQKKETQPGVAQASGSAPLERTQIVLAMAAGGMNALDIARTMGMTRDEVNLVLSVNRK